MNWLREFGRSAILVTELWLYGAAYALARLLAGCDEEHGKIPFEIHLSDPVAVSIV